MKTKSLVKKMVYQEVVTYCLNHPEWTIPDSIEAEAMEMPEHDNFWITSDLDGRYVIYHKRYQHYAITHPNFKHSVVLVKKED